MFYDDLALLSSEMFCQQKALTGSRARLLRGRWPVCMDPFAESRLFPSACGAWKRLKGWPERSQDRRVCGGDCVSPRERESLHSGLRSRPTLTDQAITTPARCPGSSPLAAGPRRSRRRTRLGSMDLLPLRMVSRSRGDPRRIPPVWRHGETLGSTSAARRLRELLPRSPWSGPTNHWSGADCLLVSTESS
jgi:hypothetical protein